MKTHVCLLAGPLALLSLTLLPCPGWGFPQPGDPPEVTVVYVDDGAPPLQGDGLSWRTAYTNLDQGLGVAQWMLWLGYPNVEVWVAQGYYTPFGGEGGGMGMASLGEELAGADQVRVNGEGEMPPWGFAWPIGLTLRGGYRGYWEIPGWEGGLPQAAFAPQVLPNDEGGGDPNDRDWQFFPTILAGNGDTLHVVTMERTTEASREIGEDGLLEGFYIENGNADGRVDPIFGLSLTASKGGGLHLIDCSPTLRDLEIRYNYAAYQGGGLYANRAAVLVNVAFVGNESAHSGGGAFLEDGAATWNRIWCANNRAGLYGGGCYLEKADVLLTNSVFVENEAGRAGGGIYAEYSLLDLNGCTMTLNRGSRMGQGGALYLDRRSELLLRNSILWNNSASRNGEIFAATPRYTQVTDCIVRGGYPGGTNILKLDPQFVMADDEENNHDLNLQETSPAIGQANPQAPKRDYYNTRRDKLPDLGACECPPLSPQ